MTMRTKGRCMVSITLFDSEWNTRSVEHGTTSFAITVGVGSMGNTWGAVTNQLIILHVHI